MNQPYFDFDAPQYEERKAKQEKAYEAAGDEWREAAYDYAVRVFLPLAAQPFIFETLTNGYIQYAKAHDLPIAEEKRAYAGLQQRLKKEGLIAVVPGASMRSYEGNLRPVYRSSGK